MARVVITKSGRRLTEADIEKLADEIESTTFDLSTWTTRPGRPRLDRHATEHSPRIAVRVPESLHRRVMRRATADGETVSRVVRRLLEEYAAVE
jgi:predicted HicB family RNase H-like nuclease